MNNDYGTRTQNQATAFPLSPSEFADEFGSGSGKIVP